jgi:predicted O-linked N-acetylglucosamine transferase (SPINDLY family)
MDVILDSIGWSGGNTSLQAIELGKPVVTLPGAFMRARFSSTSLTPS